MKINEVEQRTGITAQNIRFYEKKGLLVPDRKENKYRHYTERDIYNLKQIKLLRLLGVPISDILLLKDEEVTLERLLQVHEKEIIKKQEELVHIQKICKKIKEESISYHDLDAQKYLEEIDAQGKI
ncbi:MAG: MerR family transcriptional regulator, partial [Eubacteriales bacterium]